MTGPTTFRILGIVFGVLGFVLMVTRGSAGIAFLVIGVTFLLVGTRGAMDDDDG